MLTAKTANTECARKLRIWSVYPLPLLNRGRYENRDYRLGKHSASAIGVEGVEVQVQRYISEASKTGFGTEQTPSVSPDRTAIVRLSPDFYILRSVLCRFLHHCRNCL